MILADYHIHSTASSDARNTMTEMVAASLEAGVAQICFTDHIDLDLYSTGKPDPDCLSGLPEMQRQMKEAREAFPHADIRLGIEFGEFNHDLERALDISNAADFDFILGSLHNLRDTTDFFNFDYFDIHQCRELLDRYFDELIEMSDMPCFDVMAHIGYPARYMRNAGFDMWSEMPSFGDKIETLLKKLTENGKGIECNCSGYRSPNREGPVPPVYILNLYRLVGGEIITVGSDAHRTADAGAYLTEGFDLLKRLGFKYFTTFSKRKPEFTKIR
ncbi:MAG: histidinol-phosphatase HisJ family protein [Oscillospiraceae bacterium]|nr:histidinol-phosphatase HisJ family protein [Oscillospiraceae bacterium]